jgi:hypothetical protein
MSFFDRFKTKEDKPKKKDDQKKDESKKAVKTEKKENDAAWATSKERPVEEPEEPAAEITEEKPVEKPKKKPVKKTKEKTVKKDEEKPVKKTEGEPKMAEKKTEAKKSDKTWHITKRTEDGMWQVKAEGNTKATKLFKTKAEAEEYVKTLVSNNEGSKVIKHKKTGEFQKK